QVLPCGTHANLEHPIRGSEKRDKLNVSYRAQSMRGKPAAELTRGAQTMAEAAATPNGARRNRVVILGGGFAGINAAMELAKLPVDTTIVDRKNYHLFHPLLDQVALAVLSPAVIPQPRRPLLRDFPNLDVLMDEAGGFA